MSITITTSEYQQTKSAEIDGVAFEVRPMSSAESIAFTALSRDAEKTGLDADKAEKLLKRLEDLYFGLYDKPEEAKKLFGHLSMDAWFKIYNKIMKES